MMIGSDSEQGYALAARRHLIGCRVLWRELCAVVAQSPCSWTFDILAKELHDTPEVLRRRIQTAIDAAEAQATVDEKSLYRYRPERRPLEAIVLGYGLCSKAVAGLRAQRTPLVLARAHDCITLLLGSRQRYAQYFAANPGTFWFSQGWLETSAMPSAQSLVRLRSELEARFDDADDVEYVLECETKWMRQYSRAAWVSQLPDASGAGAQATRECAASLGWSTDELQGCNGLLQRLVDFSVMDSCDDILVAQPGETFEFTGDKEIVRVVDVAE